MVRNLKDVFRSESSSRTRNGESKSEGERCRQKVSKQLHLAKSIETPPRIVRDLLDASWKLVGYLLDTC